MLSKTMFKSGFGFTLLVILLSANFLFTGVEAKPTPAPTTQASTVVKRILVIKARWTDKDFIDNQVDNLNQWFFSEQLIAVNSTEQYESLRSFFKRVTNNEVDIQGTTIDIGSLIPNCNPDSIHQAAIAKASLMGVKVSDYSGAHIVIPPLDCFFVGGTAGPHFDPQFTAEKVYALAFYHSPKTLLTANVHEFGHLFDLGHGRALTATVPPEFIGAEYYEDKTCLMGSGFVPTSFNAPHLYQKNWGGINATTSLDISGVKQRSNYYLNTLDNYTANNLRLIRLPSSSNQEAYYISHRSSNILRGANAGTKAKITIHKDSRSWQGGTYLHYILDANQFAVINELGVKISVGAITDQGAEVVIEPAIALPAAVQNVEIESSITDPKPLITWESVATATDYRIVIEKFTIPGAGVERIIDTRTANLYYQVPTNLSPGYYRVRVLAANASGFGEPSEISFFNIAPVGLKPPSLVANISPANNQITSASPTITWTRVANADIYEIRIERLLDGTVIVKETVATNSYSNPKLILLNAGYRIRISARNTAGYGEYARAFFTVTNSPLGDFVLPIPETIPTTK